MLAAYNDQAKTEAMRIAEGAQVDRRNDHGQPPLWEAGADLDADNGGGKTALMFGHRPVVAYLLEQGADPASQTLMGISAQSPAKFTGAFHSLGSLFSK
ncbi:MAG: hypothetical protein RI601_01585 [Desulfurivibrionaceae bacterium]|nr:hypothetical protein [Desulfurivibrionaceae bacterium]